MNLAIHYLLMALMLFVAINRGMSIYQHGPDIYSVIMLAVAVLLLGRRLLILKSLHEQDPR